MQEEQGAWFYSAFGTGQRSLLISAEVRDGVAHIDFTPGVKDINNLATSNLMRVLRDQLLMTAEQYGADELEISIDGSARPWCQFTEGVCDT